MIHNESTDYIIKINNSSYFIRLKAWITFSKKELSLRLRSNLYSDSAADVNFDVVVTVVTVCKGVNKRNTQARMLPLHSLDHTTTNRSVRKRMEALCFSCSDVDIAEAFCAVTCVFICRLYICLAYIFAVHSTEYSRRSRRSLKMYILQCLVQTHL